jgi:hypothetical protein
VYPSALSTQLRNSSPRRKSFISVPSGCVAVIGKGLAGFAHDSDAAKSAAIAKTAMAKNPALKHFIAVSPFIFAVFRFALAFFRRG